MSSELFMLGYLTDNGTFILCGNGQVLELLFFFVVFVVYSESVNRSILLLLVFRTACL